MTLPTGRFEFHRNRLRGVPLDLLGIVALEILRDVAAEAAAAERAICAEICDSIARKRRSNGQVEKAARLIRSRGYDES